MTGKIHIKSSKIKIVATILGLSVLLTGIYFIFFRSNKKEFVRYTTYTECDHVHYANIPLIPSNILKDPNAIHLLHAQKNGLKQPFRSDEAFNNEKSEFVRKFILVKIDENRYYALKNLSHSQPYLIPEAVDMLNEIGYRFQNYLKEKNYKKYRFLLTSLLRTEEAQNKLHRRNRNATGHSAHLYGTTVDISYKDFYNVATDSIESSYEAIQAMTHVLVEMRQECKLLAVRERKQSCFHITVVVCRPVVGDND